MINYGHVIVQRVVSLLFGVKTEQTIPSTPYQDCGNYVMQYNRDFPGDDCARNMWKEKSATTHLELI